MAPRTDILGGGVLVAIALSALSQAADLDTGTLRSFGPGMLPTILATALLGCGVALLVVGVIQRGAAVEYFRAAWRGPLLIGLAVLVFALTIEGMESAWLLLPQLGLAVSGPLTVILAGKGAADADLRELSAAGAGLTAFCLALFNDALGMDIPVVPGAAETFLIDTLGTDATLRIAYGLLAAASLLLALSGRRAAAAGPGAA